MVYSSGYRAFKPKLVNHLLRFQKSISDLLTSSKDDVVYEQSRTYHTFNMRSVAHETENQKTYPQHFFFLNQVK